MRLLLLLSGLLAGCAHPTVRRDVAAVTAQLEHLPRCTGAAPPPLDAQVGAVLGREVEHSGVLRPAHATCTQLLCHWASPCCNGCGGEWVLEQGDVRLRLELAPGVLEHWGGRDCSVAAVEALGVPARVRGRLVELPYEQTTGPLARLRLAPSTVCTGGGVDAR